MATGDAWRFPDACSGTERNNREDPGVMSGEEAMVVTTVTAPEKGRDGEQLAGPGRWARGEHGVDGLQESRKQCEFPSSRGSRCGVENRGENATRGEPGERETGGNQSETG